MSHQTITVVICSKNNKHTVRRCVESILAQDYPIHEILAIDGCSKDGTIGIMETFPQLRIISDNGRGLAHARNLGWRNAEGKFVSYVDADSDTPITWLSQMLGEIENDDHLAGVQDTPISVSLSRDLASYLDVCFFTVSAYRAPKGEMSGIENSIWRRKALEDVGGFNEIYKKYFEDVDLIARIHSLGLKTSRAQSVKHRHFVRQTAKESFLQYYWRGYYARIFDKQKGKTLPFLSMILPSMPSAFMHSFLAFKITREFKSVLVFFVVLRKRLAFMLGYF